MTSDMTPMKSPALRVAMLSLHTSPLAALGGRETGGMNVYVREVATRLVELGVAVDVFTRRADAGLPAVTEIVPGARLVQVEAGPAAPIEKEAMPELTAAFADGVEAFRAAAGITYDVIHSHYWLSADAGDLLAERWDVPHAAMFHTLGDVKLRARASEREPEVRLNAERRLVHRLDRIVAATEHERRLLRQIYRVADARVAVVPLGVDLDQFQPGDQREARRRLGLPEDERIILAIGRIEPLKGLDVLIQSLTAMSDSSNVGLYIIGGDERARPELDRLAAIARSFGVEDRVHFLGARPHEELPDYYRASDVVAVPSFYESFGLVAVEAMASGTPVVASRVGGLASTVVDGRTGYLIAWRCPEPFAEKFDLLFANEELRRHLGRSARERMEQSYSWTRVAEAVAALYEELIAEHARPNEATAS
ncbi:MAG: glycosyltransferase [Dehalococcoidia bacterium]|nr:glycosyltransferase [Dehalococcoidia bacterium]